MKKHTHGPSLYYASDKNVLDAINLHRVDSKTVADLFKARNMLVSKRTPRSMLANQFSQLTHDYYDHQVIAACLGVIQRRERTASMIVSGGVDEGHLQAALVSIKSEMETTGDTVKITRTGANITVGIQYTLIDYGRSDFAQVEVRDGTVEFIKSGDSYIVRNTKNQYLDDVRDSILAATEHEVGASLSRQTISLFDILDPADKTSFFMSLMNGTPELRREDVTDIYVYKIRPEKLEDGEPPEPHIERASFRGNAITQSELHKKFNEQAYHVFRCGWVWKESLSSGKTYEIEALFTDPRECSGFSFLLKAVSDPDASSKTGFRRRTPRKEEIERISLVIESESRTILENLRKKQIKSEADENDDNTNSLG